MANRTYHTPFWLLIIGITLILVCPPLLSEGMFLDGVVYACISRNMAEGVGSFWFPHYTDTIGPLFRSHPPLAFGTEALFFKLFGDHLFVERLYSFLTFFLSGLMIALIWKRTTNRFSSAWLPLLFWIVIPLVSWSAVNNMLENTMTVFVLLAVYLMLVCYQTHHKVWLFLAALPLFMAFLSKGFTGLFPLVFPVLYCAFDRHHKWFHGVIDTLLLMVSLAALAGLMFLIFPDSYPYMKEYIQLQVLGSGLHESTVGSRFYIVFRLMQELIVPLVLLVLVFVLRKLLRVTVKVFEYPDDKTMFWIFLFLGLSGVLPIMVSMKQSGYYMVAAFPFFALALSHLVLATINILLSQCWPSCRTWMMIVSCCVIIAGLVLSAFRIGKYSRDEALIEDVKEVLATTDGEQVLGITQADYQQWAWHAYFMRYGKVSLDDRNLHKYKLLNDTGYPKVILSSNL